MSHFLFPPRPQPSLPIKGSALRYPVHRIFCVGRNYAAHAAEMGHEVDREAPFYFTKSCHHLHLAQGNIAYPSGTNDYHHEIELVAALGQGGRNIARADALDCLFALGLGLDMTRRDLQQIAKDKRRSWDLGKDVEQSAVITPLVPVADLRAASAPVGDRGRIELSVNGQVRQTADLADQVWSLAELIADLSTFYELAAGDLIMTGTPAGVAAVERGDRLVGHLEGVAGFSLQVC